MCADDAADCGAHCRGHGDYVSNVLGAVSRAMCGWLCSHNDCWSLSYAVLQETCAGAWDLGCTLMLVRCCLSSLTVLLLLPKVLIYLVLVRWAVPSYNVRRSTCGCEAAFLNSWFASVGTQTSSIEGMKRPTVVGEVVRIQRVQVCSCRGSM